MYKALAHTKAERAAPFLGASARRRAARSICQGFHPEHAVLGPLAGVCLQEPPIAAGDHARVAPNEAHPGKHRQSTRGEPSPRLRDAKLALVAERAPSLEARASSL